MCESTGSDEGEICRRCSGSGYSDLREEADSYDGETHTHLRGGNCYHGRNYVLFSLLAGVRQYDGHPEPLFPPRGVPEDASPEYKRLATQDGEDGHSHSWLTLTEIEAAVMTASDPLNTNPEATKMLVNHLKGEFWDGLVRKQMRPLAEKLGGGENVRIVFHFDN